MKKITEILIAFIIVLLIYFYFFDRPDFLLSKKPIQEAKKYCELLIAEIDNYYTTNDEYPVNLDLVMINNEIPSLLRKAKNKTHRINGIFYMRHKDKKGYTLNFLDPRKLSHYYEYDFKKRIWWEHT